MIAVLPGRLRHHRLDIGGNARIDRRLQAGNRLSQIDFARKPILRIEEAALVLPTETEVQCHLVVNAEVVLQVQRIHLRVGRLHRNVLCARAVLERAEQEAGPRMADLVQIRARRRVRRRVRVDREIEVAEARRFAALDAHFGARLDRVLLQVFIEAGMHAVALGNLPPRAAHAVGAVVPHVDFGEVQNRPAIHVRLVPRVRPEVATGRWPRAPCPDNRACPRPDSTQLAS